MICVWNFHNQPIKSILITFENIRKNTTGQEDDKIPGCWLDYVYLKKYCKMTAIDLSTQDALAADPKAIQQINFAGDLEQNKNK